MEDLLETDAMGVPGRNCDQDIPHYKQNERVECLENVPGILQSIPDPPSDWTLNCLLDDIAMKVGNEQLERFKALFRDYCRTQNKPYAYKEEFNEAELEEFRCKQVKFHLKGEDHLEKNHQIGVRDKIAVILGVPRENVIIIGVERVASLCVTLLIPKTYAAILQNMLEENQQFEELGALSIDWIYIDNKGYNITGTDEISKAEQQETIVSMYDLNKEKSQLLEETELKNLELQKNLDAVKQMLDIEKKRRIELENQCKLQNNVYKGFKNEVLVH